MIERSDERIRVTGALTLANAVELIAEMDAVWRAPPAGAPLVIDFAAAGPVDSAAVSLMLSWRRRARSEGFDVAFLDVPAQMRSLVDVYALDDILAPVVTDASAPGGTAASAPNVWPLVASAVAAAPGSS